MEKKNKQQFKIHQIKKTTSAGGRKKNIYTAIEKEILKDDNKKMI